MRSSATNTAVSLVEDVPPLVSAKSFYPGLSPTLCPATFSVPLLQPVGALPVIPVRTGSRPWWSCPVLRHARLSPAPCNAPWSEVLSGTGQSIIQWPGWFYPLWLGMRLGLHFGRHGQLFDKAFPLQKPCFRGIWWRLSLF